MATVAAMVLPALAARAETPPGHPRAGEVYEIRSEINSSWTSNELPGSTGSTHDVDVLNERVIAVSDAGVELLVFIPGNIPADARASDWKFPARILQPPHGPLQLLNGPELETRVVHWLSAAGMTRQACGHWIFTWNAFQIECDPQSVIQVLEPFFLWPDDLSEGASWQQTGSRAPVALRQERSGPGPVIFIARMEVDAEAVRREHARSDVVVAEVMRRALTLEAALRARSAERISGTMTTRFEMDGARNVRRRTTVTELDISGPDGRTEHRTITDTVERRLVALVLR